MVIIDEKIRFVDILYLKITGNPKRLFDYALPEVGKPVSRGKSIQN